jgi:hypothetical protein
MSLPTAWPQVLDFFGTPLNIGSPEKTCYTSAMTGV